MRKKNNANLDNGRVVYMNGSYVQESEAVVSIYDSALMFGDMVFEMTRSFNGVQFKLKEHLERLFKSINYVQIPMEYTIEQVAQACLKTQKANQFEIDDE